MSVFFISDTHFFHSNILIYCKRPFSFIQEMNETIITNWNAVIKPTDLVYHLGDFGFGKECEAIFDRLYGIKFLVTGNHDNGVIKRMAWEHVSRNYDLITDGLHIKMHHKPILDCKEFYPHAIHLYGHTHCTKDRPDYSYVGDMGISFNIGVDAWGFRPVSLDEVKAEAIRIRKEKTNEIHKN